MKRVVVEQLNSSYYFKCTLLDVEHVEIYNLIVHENQVGMTVTHMLMPSPICHCNACVYMLKKELETEDARKAKA
jgi:hypothetical protein